MVYHLSVMFVSLNQLHSQNTSFLDLITTSLCISLTKISINIFDKTSFLFFSEFKTFLHHLKHVMSWHWYEKEPIKILFFQRFLVLYIERPIISFNVKCFIMDNFDPIFPPHPYQIVCYPKLKSYLLHEVFYGTFQMCWFKNTCVHLIIIRRGWRIQHWTSNYSYQKYFLWLVSTLTFLRNFH